MLAVALQKYIPEGVPEAAIIKVTPSGNYTEGGDTLNLVSGTWSDPNGKGIIGYPENPPGVNPVVESNVGFTGADEGAYAVVVPGATLATYKLQVFAPGGTELTGSPTAYPAGILTGYFLLKVYF